MQFFNWKNQRNQLSSSSSSSSSQPQIKPIHNFQPQDLLLQVQTQCSSFLQNISNSIQFPHPHHPHNHINLNPSSLHNFIHQSLHNLQTTISTFTSTSFLPQNRPHFANLSSTHNQQPLIKEPHHCFDLAMATEDIEERLSGVPVYALSNSNEEFVLVSGASTGRSLGLFCFSKNDANILLEQMKSMDPAMRSGSSKVVAVALNKAFQLKLEGVAFRFIPDSSQIKNAIKVKQNAGHSDQGFYGVPVFQSQSLVLKSEGKRFRPVFFRQEDLENSLTRASRDQNQLNPAFKQGDIQVAVLEDMINTMKESSSSKWDEVVFIPPGFDLSTDTRQSANA